jgi:dihydroflavonol-4-reductase
MRVLVTGASGFIGRHTVAALRAGGAEVVALVRSASSRALLEAQGVRCISGDVTAPESLRGPVAEVDAVIHLASLLKMPWNQDFWTVNVEGTRAVARAVADAARPPACVVVSSLAASGPSRGEPRAEGEHCSPVSKYGRVKFAAEQAAVATGAPVSIVRPPMVYGEGDATVFRLFRTVSRGWHVLPTWRSAPVSLVHARDLAEALVAIAARGERVSREPGSGIYHVAGDEMPEYAALGGHVAAALGASPPRVVHLPAAVTWLAAALTELSARWREQPSFLNLDKYREVTAGAWTCSNEKARAHLGWAPVPLPERLAQTAAWYRHEGWL